MDARPVSQHARAIAALERKGISNAEKSDKVLSKAGSQHAVALKGLEAARSREQVATGATQHELAVRSLKGKITDCQISSDEPSPSPSPAKEAEAVVMPAWEVKTRKEKSSNQFAEAKAALFQAKETEVSAKGSQRQEAMRKLNAKGVVPTKQAFSVNAKKGSQMSEAMSAFKQMDYDVAIGGGPKKSDLQARPAAYKPVAKKSDNSQRAAAMAALQGKFADGKDDEKRV